MFSYNNFLQAQLLSIFLNFLKLLYNFDKVIIICQQYSYKFLHFLALNKFIAKYTRLLNIHLVL